jgi:diaminopimelate decarboxylase
VTDKNTPPVFSRVGASNGTFRVGSSPISDIASEFGTPLFLYDGALLEQKWNVLRSTYPPEFEISYSVKANPNPAILRFFLSKGCGLEIASGGEFHLGLHAGCPPEKILFAGPGKTDADLELVLTHGIGEIHVESLSEIKRVCAMSRRLGSRADVAIRVNPSAEAQGGAMRMGGKAAPFGIDEEILDDVLTVIITEPFLNFRGIHLYTGTQILDHAVLIRQYRKGLEIAFQAARRFNSPLHTVDFGGGLGIPYFPGETELDMESLRNELHSLISDVSQEPLFSGTNFVVEPGRYLVAEAGIYVARVTDVKMSRGKKFLILDGGMNHHLAASGNLGQVIKKNFPVAIFNKTAEVARERVDIVGPLCTPLDVLARDVELPPAEVGDFVGILKSGAYARGASPLGFLSHPSPPEVLVQDGETRLIRRRGNYKDLVADLSLDKQQ